VFPNAAQSGPPIVQHAQYTQYTAGSKPALSNLVKIHKSRRNIECQQKSILNAGMVLQGVVGVQRLRDGQQLAAFFHLIRTARKRDRVDLQTGCAQILDKIHHVNQPVQVAPVQAHDHLKAQSFGPDVLSALEGAFE